MKVSADKNVQSVHPFKNVYLKMKKLSLYVFLVLLMISACSEQNQLSECIEGDCNNGYGTFKWTFGGKYVGEFKDGKRHGQGTYTWSEGNKYVGGLKDGEPNGQGTFTFANGNKYVGEFKDGKPNGQGTYTWTSGEFAGHKYVGGFKDNKRHGQGTFTWANGVEYVGEYKDGQPYGQGTWTYEDGRVEKGILKKDKLIKFATVSKMMPMNKSFDFICYNTCKERNDENYCRQKCSIHTSI